LGIFLFGRFNLYGTTITNCRILIELSLHRFWRDCGSLQGYLGPVEPFLHFEWKYHKKRNVWMEWSRYSHRFFKNVSIIFFREIARCEGNLLRYASDHQRFGHLHVVLDSTFGNSWPEWHWRGVHVRRSWLDTHSSSRCLPSSGWKDGRFDQQFETNGFPTNHCSITEHNSPDKRSTSRCFEDRFKFSTYGFGNVPNTHQFNPSYSECWNNKCNTHQFSPNHNESWNNKSWIDQSTFEYGQ